MRLHRITFITLSCLLLTVSAWSELTFFGWSDQHVKTDGSAEHVEIAIDAMNTLPGTDWPDAIGGKVNIPAFVIGLGDVTEWPTRAAMQTYDELITQRLRFPSYDVAGNHDSGGKERNATMFDWFKRRFGALSYTFEKNGIHFVMLYSEYDDSLGNPAQPVTKEALAWLKEQLAMIPQGKPVIVGTHLCFEAMTNRDEFVAAMDGANVLCVLGGHYHKATINRYGGVHFVQLPSPEPKSPSEVTVFYITEDRLIAIPYDYTTKKWTEDQGRILDIQIDAPEPKPISLIPEKEIKTLAIGAQAPDFSLPGVDGRIWSLRDFSEAKILAIIFTANHCPTAQAYEDRIMGLVRDYGSKGVAVVAISPNDPKAVRLDELGYTDLGDSFRDMVYRAKQKNFNFPYLYDGQTQAVSRIYGPRTTPHVFLFDRDRKLRYTGRIDNNERIGKATEHNLQNALDALLADQPVSVETTPTFGCSIKWAEKRDGVARAFERWAAEPVKLEKIDIPTIRKLLKNDSDKLRLINFWATWCGPCVAEFPELIEINRMYRNREFEMITISVDAPEREKNVLEFLEKNEASCTNYQYDSTDVYKLIEAVGHDWQGSIPFTLLVKPGGEILASYVGMIEPLEVKQTIVGYVGRYYK
ncbi:MAG: redoxin domain-containing protein [Sedimentisphaerales bacterium]|nr:redoxin domain-containing protein [Sedimentisphaerales bacterium]